MSLPSGTRSAVGSTIAQRIRISRFGDANGRCGAFEVEDAAEVQLSSRPGAQPIQSGAPSRHEANLQAETVCCLGRVARARGVDRRARAGSPRHKPPPQTMASLSGPPRSQSIGLPQRDLDEEFTHRCTTNSIRSAISSRGKSTSRDALLHWPSGALSRHRSPFARWLSRCVSTTLRYFDTAPWRA